MTQNTNLMSKLQLSAIYPFIHIFNHEYLTDHSRCQKFLLRIDSLTTYLILIVVELLQHVTFRSYNVTKFIEIVLFATFITNFSKFWRDGTIWTEDSYLNSWFRSGVLFCATVLTDRTKLFFSKFSKCEHVMKKSSADTETCCKLLELSNLHIFQILFYKFIYK